MQLPSRRNLITRLLAPAVGVLVVTSCIAMEQQHPNPTVVINDLQSVASDELDQQQPEFNRTFQIQRQRRQWLQNRLAELSREQREQMRVQIRAQRIQMRDQQPVPIRADLETGDAANRQNFQAQGMSTDERREFHQWMHERHEGRARR